MRPVHCIHVPTFILSVFVLCLPMAGAGQLNLDIEGVAISGYDPVSYHLKTGAQKGRENLLLTHNGSIYYFVSSDNRALFMKDPERYTPAFGGWCAWAMLDGETVEINPQTYKLVNNKTYLFYNSFFSNTLNKWDALAQETGEQNLTNQAESAYKVLVKKAMD